MLEFILNSHLKKIGFKQATGYPCLHIASVAEMFLIAVYVDDILLAPRSDEELIAVKLALSEIFQAKDLLEVRYFMGQDHKNRSV